MKIKSLYTTLLFLLICIIHKPVTAMDIEAKRKECKKCLLTTSFNILISTSIGVAGTLFACSLQASLMTIHGQGGNFLENLAKPASSLLPVLTICGMVGGTIAGAGEYLIERFHIVDKINQFSTVPYKKHTNKK